MVDLSAAETFHAASSVDVTPPAKVASSTSAVSSTRQRTLLTGKIHRATVTGADLDYVGSITIDVTLMRAADILPGEQVDVVNVSNGARLTTYAIPGEAHSGDVVLNGAAAHYFSAGDIVIIMCYGMMSDAEAHSFEPHIVFVDAQNHIVECSTEPGQVPGGYGLKSSGIPVADMR